MPSKAHTITSTDVVVEPLTFEPDRVLVKLYVQGSLGLSFSISRSEIESKQMCFVFYGSLRNELKIAVKKLLPRKLKRVKVVSRKRKYGKAEVKVKVRRTKRKN